MKPLETLTASDVSVFVLPDLGEGLAEATLVRWLVEVGDQVSTDQPIVEVESAKAVVEIPCPYPGHVSIQHGAAGDVIAVGSPLVTVRALAPTSSDAPPFDGRRAAPADLPAPLIGFGASVDEADEADEALRTIIATRVRGRSLPKSRPQLAGQAPAPTRAPAGAAPRPGSHEVIRTISPVVRQLARHAGLDLATVQGTGPHGLVRRTDVEYALRHRDTASARPDTAAAPAVPQTAPPPVALPDEDATPIASPNATPEASRDSTPVPSPNGIVRIPIQGRRRVIADRMSRSRREIPEATAWRDVDASDLLAARRTINEARPDRPVSVLGLIGRFCAAGLARYPALNAHVDTDAGEIVRFARIHLGFAIAVEDSLMVGVVHDAQDSTAVGLTSDIRRLTAQARQGGLTAADLTGGTFTVNNHGALGSDGAVPIINHPEVAQLGVGRITDRPWVVDGKIRPRKVMQLTMTFDHRACDGAPVGGFLDFLAHCIEQPLTMLGEL